MVMSAEPAPLGAVPVVVEVAWPLGNPKATRRMPGPPGNAPGRTTRNGTVAPAFVGSAYTVAAVPLAPDEGGVVASAKNVAIVGSDPSVGDVYDRSYWTL